MSVALRILGYAKLIEDLPFSRGAFFAMHATKAKVEPIQALVRRRWSFGGDEGAY